METSAVKEQDSSPASDSDDVLIWGAEAIGREINRSRDQVYYLNRCGRLKSYVFKAGHRTMAGWRNRLRKFRG
jgi:hypothetical protein